MSVKITAHTALRVLNQLRHDLRTIAMLLLVPTLLMTLLRYIFEDARLFDRVGLQLLGVFPFVVMFLVTSVAMLRERTSGTLERLLTTPMAKLDLLLGYGLAFALVATAQALLACTVSYWWLGLDTAGSPGWVIVIAVANGILGMALGLLVSAFAQSEFQAVQFMPAIVVPQILLGGLLTPRSAMAGWLEAISNALPLSYVIDGLNNVGAHSEVTGDFTRDLVIIVAATLLCLTLAAATLRRRTA